MLYTDMPDMIGDGPPTRAIQVTDTIPYEAYGRHTHVTI